MNPKKRRVKKESDGATQKNESGESPLDSMFKSLSELIKPQMEGILHAKLKDDLMNDMLLLLIKVIFKDPEAKQAFCGFLADWKNKHERALAESDMPDDQRAMFRNIVEKMEFAMNSFINSDADNHGGVPSSVVLQ